MLFLFLCLVLCTISNGDIAVKCGNDHGWSFVDAEDGVHGRYRLELCVQTKRPISEGQWIVSLGYNTQRDPKDCHQYEPEFARDKTHSRFKENFVSNLNCTNLCLSTTFDLIFNGTCYSFKTSLTLQGSTSWQYNVHYVYNNYTKYNFTASETMVTHYTSGDNATFEWFLNLIPATKYTMELCPLKEENTTEQCTAVTSSCWTPWRNRTSILCTLRPPTTRYCLVLQHDAPWCAGESTFGHLTQVEFTPEPPLPPMKPPEFSQPASTELWWALGGVAALALGGAAALVACRVHGAARLRERVLRDWPTRTRAAAALGAGPAAGGGRRVLLLYARDCAPLMAVAAQLRELLSHAADHVYDLYSPEVVRQAARAPGEWLRRVLARPDVRVLLLQTPAAACLHDTQLSARGTQLTLQQPLLGRRVLPRVPHCSDALLPLALRLLADTAYTTLSYKKFYIATIAGLEAELVREVTPRRRYVLPGAAELLLRELADGALEPHLGLEAQLQRFHKAVRDLHDYVRANPNYLDEELIFFDYD